MARGRGLEAVIGVLVALALAFGAPAAALGSSTQESLFMDDNRLLYRGADVTVSTFSELKSLGVDRVRLSVHWKVLSPSRAPANPADPAAYEATKFDPLDFAVETAHAMGIGVLFNVTGPAPEWATPRVTHKGARPGVFKPNPQAFGAFVEMLARRYDGSYKDESDGVPLPRVRAWSIWNEPNWGNLLQPQWEASTTKVRTRKGTRTIITGWTPMAPHIYRRMYREATAGLQRAGHIDDHVLLGETAPLGSRYRGADQHLKPVLFLRELFCLDAKLNPYKGLSSRKRGCDYRQAGQLHATGYAHHPYSITSPPATPFLDPNSIVLADRQRLYTLLDRAAALGRITPGLPMWITEYGYQTSPPDPYRGVTLNQQARWLSEAELITWGDPRIAAHTQFLLYDDEPRTDYSPADRRYWMTYQTGLRFADGTPKPSYDAYRLPFFGPSRVQPGQQLRLWGMVRAARNGSQQPVELQWRPDSGAQWQTLTAIVVSDSRGYFTYGIDTPNPGEYRMVWEENRDNQPRVLGAAQPPRHASAPVHVAVG